MKLYVLHDVEVTGLAGPVPPILLSNREYRPDAGPNAGKPYRAAWTKSSFASWSLTKAGLDANGPLTTTTGLAAFQPGPVDIVNSKVNRAATSREFDSLKTLQGFSATYVTRAAYGKPSGAWPAWSDFVIVSQGRIRVRPEELEKGRALRFHLEPTQSYLDAPQLSRSFTGYAGHYRSALETSSTTAPSVMGGDFTVQAYGGIKFPDISPFEGGSPFTEAVGDKYHLYRLQNAGNVDLLSLYIEDQGAGSFFAYASVLTAAGAVAYPIGGFSSFIGATRLDELVLSWKETGPSPTVKAWFNGVLAFEGPIINPSAGAGTEDHFLLFDTVPENEVALSSVRVFSKAIDETGTDPALGDIRGPLEFPAPDLLSGYEMNRGEGTIFADYGSHKEPLAAPAGLWENSITVQVDGAPPLAGRVIPAAIGQPRNVPVAQFDRRSTLGRGVIAAACDPRRIYVNGVTLVKRDEIDADTVIDSAAGTITATAAAINEGFGLTFTQGERLDVSGVGEVTIDAIDPSPETFVRGTGSASSGLTLQVSGLPGGTFTGVRTFTSVGSTWVSSPAQDPYGAPGNTNMGTARFLGDFPSNATADVVGDPAILATSPPVETFVDPGDPANAVTQLLTRYGITWDAAKFTTPDYGAVPGSLGYFIGEDRTAASVLSEILAGYLAWLDEGPDGVSELRALDLSPGPADHVIDQASLIDVSMPTRSASSGAEYLPGFRVNYRRAWVQQDGASIPAYADELVAAFVSEGGLWLNVGTPQGSEAPVFVTFELRGPRARQLGEGVLTLSRAQPINFRFRYDPTRSQSVFKFNDRVDVDAPDLGRPGFSGKIVGHAVTLAAGTTTLTLVEAP